MRKVLLLCLLVIPLLLPAVGSAGPFTSIFVIGDSLSDTGNAFLGTAGAFPPAPPYAAPRISDGPVWIDFFATSMGVPAAAMPSLGGGTNFSVGGALSGLGGQVPNTGLQAQAAILTGLPGPLDPAALYIVGGGGNDIRAALLTPNPVLALGNSVADFAQVLNALYLEGARNFLVLNVPDIGKTPEALQSAVASAAATAASAQYNAGLNAQLDLFRMQPGVILQIVDLFLLTNLIQMDALNNGGAVYGITNTNTPCFAGVLGSPGANCAMSLFVDNIHPTSQAHRAIANAALNAVPEPATFALFAAGLAGLLLLRKRLN